MAIQEKVDSQRLTHQEPGLPPTQAVKETPTYSAEELLILGKIKDIISGDFFHHVPEDSSNGSTSTIIKEARALIVLIRAEKRDPQGFFDYQDTHFDSPQYAFLKESYPGLNVNGWRVLMAELDPLQYGTAIQRKEFQIRGTISQRSAKK